MNDGYIEDAERVVLFRWKRYRVTKSTKTKVYALWYGGSIILINGDRDKIMKRFQTAIEDMKGFVV